MRTFSESIKGISSKKINVSFGLLNYDKILILQVIFIFLLIFFKVYIRCLFINEGKKVNTLKYEIKMVQGELGKIKTEIDKYVERERLDVLAKAFKKEDEIEVYVVR